jgi:Uma2 family endonuclease
MTQTAPLPTSLLTIEDYFKAASDRDYRYELVDGALVEMPTESPENCKLAKLLMLEFAQFVAIALINLKDLEMVVSGKRTQVRLPDLAVLSEEGYAALVGQRRNTITPEMPPPRVVVEVVSPGAENRDRDYRYKHTEYAARGIAEYWIVDPELQRVTICLWVNGQYEDTVYVGNDAIASTVMPGFTLSAMQILALGHGIGTELATAIVDRLPG